MNIKIYKNLKIMKESLGVKILEKGNGNSYKIWKCDVLAYSLFHTVG